MAVGCLLPAVGRGRAGRAGPPEATHAASLLAFPLLQQSRAVQIHPLIRLRFIVRFATLVREAFATLHRLQRVFAFLEHTAARELKV